MVNQNVGKRGTWRYIKKNFLPQLRAGAVCVIYYKREPVKETPKEVQREEEKVLTPPWEPGTRDIFNPGDHHETFVRHSKRIYSMMRFQP